MRSRGSGIWGWRPIMGALAVGAIAFGLSLQGAPAGDTAGGVPGSGNASSDGANLAPPVILPIMQSPAPNDEWTAGSVPMMAVGDRASAPLLSSGSGTAETRGGCVCDFECDDGLTCNGRERCDAGTCVDDPQGPVVCAGTRICIEELDGCQDSCEDGSGGDDISLCNDGSGDPCEDAETCDLFVCNPADDNCPADGDAYVCQSPPDHCSGAPSAKTPAPCTTDADCPNGHCLIDEGYCSARGYECVRAGLFAGNCSQPRGSCCSGSFCDGIQVEDCTTAGGEWYSDRDPGVIETDAAETGCTTECPVYSSGIRENRDLAFSVGPIVPEAGCLTISGGTTFNEIGDDYTIVGGSYLALERFDFTGGSLVPAGDLVFEFYDSSQNLVGRFDSLGYPIGNFHWSLGSERNPLVKTSPDNLIIPPTGYVVMRSAKTGIDRGVNSALTWVSTRDNPTRAGEVEIGANDPNSMWVDGVVGAFLSAGGVDNNTGLCDDGTVCELDGDPPCGDASTCTAAPDILSFAMRGTKLSEPIGACCGETGGCTDTNPWNCSVCSISGDFCLGDRDCPTGETCGGPSYLNLKEDCEVDGDCAVGAGVCQLLWNTGDLADSANDFPPAGRCVVTCTDGSAPCDKGACCVDTTCTDLTTAGGDLLTQCSNLGGTFLGFGTDCQPNCCKGAIQECNPVAAAPPSNDDWDESVCAGILGDGTPNAGAFCWLSEPTVLNVPASPADPPVSKAITVNPDDVVGGFCECSGIPCQQQAPLGDTLACAAGRCSISGGDCRSFGDCPLEEDQCEGAERCIYRDCGFPGPPDPMHWISVSIDACALLTVDFCCTDEADSDTGAGFTAFINLHTGCVKPTDRLACTTDGNSCFTDDDCAGSETCTVDASRRCRVMGGTQYGDSLCSVDSDCLEGLCIRARDGSGDPLPCHRDCECRDASLADGDALWKKDRCAGAKACDLVDPLCDNVEHRDFPSIQTTQSVRGWSNDAFPGCGGGDRNIALQWQQPAGTYWYPVFATKTCRGAGTNCNTDADCDPGDDCQDPFTRYQMHWTAKACPESACCTVEDQCSFSLTSCVDDTDCTGKQCTDDDSVCTVDGDCTPGTCSISGDPCHRTDPDCAQGSCNNSGDPCYTLADCTVADTSCDGAEVCNGGAFCQDETCDPLPFCEVTDEETCNAKPESYWAEGSAVCGIGASAVCNSGACCRDDLGICEDNNSGTDFGTYERCSGLANTRYRGGAECPTELVGAESPCPICPFQNAGNCQEVETVSTFGFIILDDINPDNTNKARVADDFIAATTGAIHRVCWVPGFFGTGECSSAEEIPSDAFTMQVYLDDGTGFVDESSNLAASPVAINVDQTTPSFASRIWDYSGTLADQSAFNLTAGQCYWLEIAAIGNDTCGVYWTSAEHTIGNQWSLQDFVEFGSYGPEDQNNFDMAFCLAVGDDLGTSPAIQLAANGKYGCGEVLGACCLCPTGCVTTTFQECETELKGSWTERTDCNEAGVCSPAGGNDLCEYATTITHKSCTSDADCDGLRYCGDDPTTPCTDDTDCTAGTCDISTGTSCHVNADCPLGEVCENAETCSVLPEDVASVCLDDQTGNGTSICTSLLVDFDNRCAETDGPNASCGADTANPPSGLRNDVWFQYTAPACGTVTIEGCGLADNDGFGVTYLASRDDCATLSQDDERKCNDDGCGGASPPKYSFKVQEGNVYLVRHGGWNNENLIGNPLAKAQFRLRLAPSPCVTVQPPLAAGPPHNRDKNRYISFDPNPLNAGNASVAFEVLYDDGTRADVHVGWVGPPGAGWSGSSSCPNCAWVVDEANRGELSGDDWLAAAQSGVGDVIHVGDCEIAPDRTYKIRTVDAGSGVAATPDLTVNTTAAPNPGVIFWADAVGGFGFWCSETYECCGDNPDCPPATACPGGQTCIQQWPPPDGSTNFTDVSATIRAFQQIGIFPETEWVDMHGALQPLPAREQPANHLANFADVQPIIQAFQGYEYLGDPDNTTTGNGPPLPSECPNVPPPAARGGVAAP